MNPLESLYIHFPFCRHLCNYCDFYKKIPHSHDEFSQFEKLFLEIADQHQQFMVNHNQIWAPLKSLYIGGGTPSLWGARGANFLRNFLNKEKMSLSDNCEFTLEVNPGTWTEEGIEAWTQIGVNRFSLGVQALRSDYLKKLDRVHSLQDVHDTLDFFNKKNFRFSVDFMIGLPWSESEKRHIDQELFEILRYDPEHLSLYILTPKGAYPHREFIPSDEFIEKEYLLVSKYLRDRGFEHYEVSNFARPGKESVHNLRYWECQSVAALGPSAVGFFSQSRFRYKWQTTKAKAQIENLNDEEDFIEKLYMGMRIKKGITLKNIFNSNQILNLQPLFSEWRELGYCLEIKDKLRLEPRGYLILDTLIQQIFNKIN